MVRRSAATGETVEDYAAHLDGRLGALARAQVLATRDGTSDIDLEDLVREELLSHGALPEGRVHIEGRPVRLDAERAELFALAVHELATNAVKFGAFLPAEGRLDVRWAVTGADGDARLAFDWTETGLPPTASLENRKGFGTELIERTVRYELGAETSLALESGVLRCSIRLPLARLGAH
jgi:two-component system CheB/CheR fusion protein